MAPRCALQCHRRLRHEYGEIQEAAEIITAAVAPDANIIFGATLKPEIEDELIITVIATGFDSEYFRMSVLLRTAVIWHDDVTGCCHERDR